MEPDCSPNWVYSNPLTFSGVTVGIKQILQPLFNKYGMAPTYLINNVVLENRESVDVFKTLEGKYELGTHLHPEFIAPQKLFNDYAGKKGEANCCFLPSVIESEKIVNITNLFFGQFNYLPESFRAGRFSAGPNTIKTLIELGYKVDSSVTPGIVWKDKTREGIVDYSDQKAFTYWLDKVSYPAPGVEQSLLEVPVSIGEVKKVFRKLKQCWLRPHLSSVKEMITLSRQIISDTPPEHPVILNMMFHNVEVMPGLSPYAVDEPSAKRYIHQIESFLKWCSRNRIAGITLKGYYDKVKQ